MVLAQLILIAVACVFAAMAIVRANLEFACVGIFALALAVSLPLLTHL